MQAQPVSIRFGPYGMYGLTTANGENACYIFHHNPLGLHAVHYPEIFTKQRGPGVVHAPLMIVD